MPTKILDGCVIALSGPLLLKHADIIQLVKKNGGLCTARPNWRCTHLICSYADFANKARKVREAQNLWWHVAIVSIQWLLESLNEKKRLSETPYLMDPAAKRGKSGTPKSSGSPPTAGKSKKGNKRRRSELQDEDSGNSGDSADESGEPAAKKMKDSQKVTPKSVIIPVDQTCNLSADHHVFVHPDGTIYDAALNQTDIDANRNKFYRLQILVSEAGEFRVWSRWGRVDRNGRSALQYPSSEADALKMFEKKFREKSGLSWVNRHATPKKGKLAFIEKDYEQESENETESEDDQTQKGSRSGSSLYPGKVRSELSEPVQQLMELIFNKAYFEETMREMNYNANKLPLGKLSKRTLMAGFQKLQDVARAIDDPAQVTSRTSLSNDYYTIIPHSFGRERPPIISDRQTLAKEIRLLETLLDMEIANAIMHGKPITEGKKRVHPLDQQYHGLKMKEMTALSPDTQEFIELRDYLMNSLSSGHSLRFDLQQIFRIERKGEFKRFKNSKFGKLQASDRRLLWHGSRATNFGGILSQGLRIAPPEAPVNGYMFGKGIYLADISSKSANYCVAADSGHTGLLLLCEAELGDPMQELYHRDIHADIKAQTANCYSTLGKGLIVPPKWKDASCVHKRLKGVLMPDVVNSPPQNTGNSSTSLWYNEYIVYDVSQVRLRYLFRVKITTAK